MQRLLLSYVQRQAQVKRPARCPLPIRLGTPEMGVRQGRGWEEVPGARDWVLTAPQSSLMTPGPVCVLSGPPSYCYARMSWGSQHRGTAKPRCKADGGVQDRDEEGDALAPIKLSGWSRPCMFPSVINSAGQVLLLRPLNRGGHRGLERGRTHLPTEGRWA